MNDESLESLLKEAVPPTPAAPHFVEVWDLARRRAFRRRVAAGVACIAIVVAVSTASVAVLRDFPKQDSRNPAVADGPAPYRSDAESGSAVVECEHAPLVNVTPYASRVYASPHEAAAAQLSDLGVDRSDLDSGEFSDADGAATYSFSDASFSDAEGVQIVVALEEDGPGWRIESAEYCANLVRSDGG